MTSNLGVVEVKMAGRTKSARLPVLPATTILMKGILSYVEEGLVVRWKYCLGVVCLEWEMAGCSLLLYYFSWSKQAQSSSEYPSAGLILDTEYDHQTVGTRKYVITAMVKNKGLW